VKEKDWTSKDIREKYNVSRETMEKLDCYVTHLLEWQNRFNLIGNSTVDNIWGRHVLDSLQLMTYIPKDFKVLIDIGTGAGLPGFILAIYFAESNKDIYLVDSSKKKCSFLNFVSVKCDTPVIVLPERIENLSIKGKIKADIITARAFSGIDNILKLSKPYISPQTKYLLQRGAKAKTELAKLNISSLMNIVYHNSILDKDSYIIDFEYR
jgi:16S rRNA (guanine527-N7)-methyltransferase|tara:strand:+ start:3921 stop:4550 length:630 start_codon:yes stop_codon:yes gene_type:complete